jgi:hypothetical protein
LQLELLIFLRVDSRLERCKKKAFAMGIHLLNDLLDDLAILYKNRDYEGVMQRIATYYYDGLKFSSKDFTIYFISSHSFLSSSWPMQDRHRHSHLVLWSLQWEWEDSGSVDRNRRSCEISFPPVIFRYHALSSLESKDFGEETQGGGS